MKNNFPPLFLLALTICLSFMSMAPKKDCLTTFNETVNQSLDDAHEDVRDCGQEPYAIASKCELEVAVRLNHEINGAVDVYEHCKD